MADRCDNVQQCCLEVKCRSSKLLENNMTCLKLIWRWAALWMKPSSDFRQGGEENEFHQACVHLIETHIVSLQLRHVLILTCSFIVAWLDGDTVGPPVPDTSSVFLSSLRFCSPANSCKRQPSFLKWSDARQNLHASRCNVSFHWVRCLWRGSAASLDKWNSSAFCAWTLAEYN